MIHPRTFAASAFLALAPMAALAAPYEITLRSCDEMPKVDTRNITNSRGDQASLNANESFSLTFAYRTRQKTRLILDAVDGKQASQDFDRVSNVTTNFRGDSVESVRNQAEAWVRSREYFLCKPISATAPAADAPPPSPAYPDEQEY